MAHRTGETFWLPLLSVILSALAFFGVVLWWLAAPTERDIDELAWSMSVLHTFLAIGAFTGFWLLRDAAQGAAREEAKKVAEYEAKYEARRAAVEYLATLYRTDAEPDDTKTLMNALEGGSDEYK
jgi:hypothetical protein